MSKVKIKLVSIGHLPINFQPKKVLRWKSSLFETVGELENYALRCDSDGLGWEFSDELVKTQLPVKFDADFMIALVNVPIENNWYSRRLGDNKVVFTFYQIKDILETCNIPLENVIYRLLYAYTLLYKRAGDTIPDYGKAPGFTHDETRGCLFDMNGIKTDLIASCNNPIICDECEERLKQEKVSNHLISSAQNEIKCIRKDLYYRAIDFVKRHPLWSLALSSLFAIALGVVSSFAYDVILSVAKQV
jgi:hypothetical protein